jgi:hypothetical protein
MKRGENALMNYTANSSALTLPASVHSDIQTSEQLVRETYMAPKEKQPEDHPG